MYLMIFEDSSLSTIDELTDDDKQAADDGYLDIIDFDTHEQYSQGEWHLINHYER